MARITNTEIEFGLAELLAGLADPIYKDLLPIFHTLYHHGFRIGELYGMHNWTIDESGTVTCFTSKGSNDRSVLLTDFHEDLIPVIGSGVPYQYLRSYSAYRRVYHKMVPLPKMGQAQKAISTHIFRHMYVKRLRFSGLTNQQVRDLLGLVSTDIVKVYHLSKFFEIFELA